MRRYRAESEAAVAGLPGARDLVYDEASRQVLDLWAPGEPDTEAPRPVFVFLHGGYWRMLSRADSAFMARTLAAHGIATAVVEYDLAPAATLEEIVRQVRAAVAWIYRHAPEHGLDRRRIVVGGSSAGGHLTGMTMLDGWQRELGVPEDTVAAAMPFSGLFDIEPLLASYVNDWMTLDVPRARALSPLRHPPGRGMPTRIVVAEKDPEGFHHQSREFARDWEARFPGTSELIVAPGKNHFDVVLELTDPDSALTATLVELCLNGA